MVIGLKRGTVKLLQYDPAWPTEFETERDRYTAAKDEFIKTALRKAK